MDTGSASDYSGGGGGISADASDWGGDYSSGGVGDYGLGAAGLSVNPAEFDFSSFDTGGIGVDNGNYSDPSSGYGPGMQDNTGLFEQLSRILNNPFGKFGLSVASKSNPGLQAFMGALGTFNKGQSMSQGTRGQAIGGMLGGLGGMIGLAGGPAGAIAGSYTGNALGNAIGGTGPSYSGPSMDNTGISGGNLALGGLGALYQNRQNNNDIGGQIKSLQSLYSQNSPYAQQMRQALERKDAASGRRSQYGPREVELQARLADAASRQAPTLAGLYGQRMQNRNNLLNTVGYGIQQAGGLGNIYNGLTGLFGGNNDFGIGQETQNFNDVLPDTWGA